MNLVSNLLLLVSKEAISGKNFPNQPPLNARRTDLERDSGNSKILCCMTLSLTYVMKVTKFCSGQLAFQKIMACLFVIAENTRSHVFFS